MNLSFLAQFYVLGLKVQRGSRETESTDFALQRASQVRNEEG